MAGRYAPRRSGYDATVKPAGNGEGQNLAEIRRLVVREVNWLGDLVLSLPALRALRRRFARAHLAVLVREELAGFFAGLDWVDEVIAYRVRRGIRGLADRLSVAGALRARSFPLAVVLPKSFDSALSVALAGIPMRVGWRAQGRSFLLTHASAPCAGAERHQVYHWLAMVADTLAAAGSPDDYRCLQANRLLRERMAQWLGQRRRRPQAKLIALAPEAAYGPAKQWPAAHFGALIDLLAERFGAECVIVGGQPQWQQAAVAAAGRSGAIMAAGETDAAQLVALLSLCDGFVGNDSGPMHLAASLGIAAVGIFGSTDPGRTGPLGARSAVLHRPLECSPCFARTCRFGHYNCLVGIGPEQAAAQLVKLGVFD